MGFGKFQLAPEQASNFAREYDSLYWLLSALTFLFTTIVLVLIIYMVVKYRRGSNANRRNPMHHNERLEALFIGIPLILGLGIFAWGTKIFVQMREMPDNAKEIFVVGKRWMWHIQNTNGIRENNELHIPVGQPVKVIMISQDVIHGFFIPAFRTQYQVVPGRYTTMWFTATKPGKYNLFCTIHCGTQHSEMGGYVYAMDPKDYAVWEENGGNRFKAAPVSMAEAGRRLFDETGCSGNGSCHGGTDTKHAPSLLGLYGAKRTFVDGSTAIADREYLREAIIHPYTQLNKGYIATMPDYSKDLSEDQVNSLVEYIKTLGTPQPEKSTQENMSKLDMKATATGTNPRELTSKGIAVEGTR